MSKENQANVAEKITTPEPISTTSTTPEIEATTKDTTLEKDLTSNAGIIEEAVSTEVPVEVAAVEAATEVVAATEIEPYELSLDEESPLTDEEFDEVVQEAERLKLGKEDAEKLIKMREYSHKASTEIFEKSIQERNDNMVKEYKSDTALHTVEAKLSLREAVKAFGGDPSFKEMFKDPSMNFNVPLAKFLISVGDRIRGGQDTLPTKKGSSVISDDASTLTKAANNFYKGM